MKVFLTLIAFLPLALLTGCLEFGDDKELKDDQIDLAALRQVTQVTGVIFPEGSKGKDYYYLGSGIDDALWLKASIPQGKKNEFLQNEIFSHADATPSAHMTLDRDWWKVDTLERSAHYSMEINQKTEFVGCSIGIEAEELIIYIYWFST